MKTDLIQLTTPNGKPIRKATRVTLDNGKSVTFTERMPKRDAIQQTLELIAFEFGRMAFQKGIKAACHDQNVMNMLKGNKIGEGIPVLTAWNKGWHFENAKGAK